MPLRDMLKIIQKFKEIATLGKLVSDSPDTKYDPKIDSESDNTYFTYNKWTLLKLMFLQLYTPLYVSIINKRYAESNYIDVFSGSGINRFENTDIILAGSPIVALSFTPIPFHNAYLCDNDSRKINSLEKRIKRLIELSTHNDYREYIFSEITTNINYGVADANRILPGILSFIENKHNKLINQSGRGCHNLIFIDPFGLELKKSVLQRIINSKVRSDIILLLNTYAIGLYAYNIIHHGYNSKTLDEHLGFNWLHYIESIAREKGKSVDRLSRIELSEILREYYLRTLGSDQIIIKTIELPLKLEHQQFDLIFICRKTKSGNPFLVAVDYIKRLIEETPYPFIDTLKDFIKTGKFPGLLKLMIDNPKKALEKYKTIRRYKSLTNYTK